MANLHIAINDVASVKISEGENNLCSIETRSRLSERSAFTKMCEQLSTVGELHDEAEMVGGLE